MKYKIENKKNSDILKIALDKDEKFKSRAKSVSSYGGDVQTKTETTRSIWKALDSRENFPMTSMKCKSNNGVVNIVSPYPSRIKALDPDVEFNVQSLGFLATCNSYDVSLNTSKIYRNDVLGVITLDKNRDNKDNDGDDVFFISGYEGISKIELSKNQQTTIREDYLLAFDGSVTYSKKSSSGLKSKALGAKDKPMIKLTGPGNVYQHVRSPIKNSNIFDKIQNDS